MAEETTITSYDDAWVKRMLESVYGDGAKDARIAEGAGKRLEETLYACSRSATKIDRFLSYYKLGMRIDEICAADGASRSAVSSRIQETKDSISEGMMKEYILKYVIANTPEPENKADASSIAACIRYDDVYTDTSKARKANLIRLLLSKDIRTLGALRQTLFRDSAFRKSFSNYIDAKRLGQKLGFPLDTVSAFISELAPTLRKMQYFDSLWLYRIYSDWCHKNRCKPEKATSFYDEAAATIREHYPEFVQQTTYNQMHAWAVSQAMVAEAKAAPPDTQPAEDKSEPPENVQQSAPAKAKQ